MKLSFSLRAQFLLSIGGVITVSIGLLTAILLQHQRAAAIDHEIRDLRDVATYLVSPAGQNGASWTERMPTRLRAWTARGGGPPEFAWVEDDQRRVLDIAVSDAAVAEHVELPVPGNAAEPLSVEQLTGAGEWIVVPVAASTGDASRGGGRIVMGRSIERLHVDLAARAKRAWVLATILVALAWVYLTLVGSRTLAAPLRQLRAVTRQIAEGENSLAAPIRAPDELGELAADFNRVTDRLRRSREEIERKNKEIQRKHAELFSASQFLESILRASTDHAIIAEDLDGRILSVNEGALRVFGYSEDDVVGRHLQTLLSEPEAGFDTICDLYRRVLDGERGVSCEIHARHQDGRTFPAHFSFSLRSHASGEPAGFVIIARDLTRDKEEQELILRNRELERASRLKSEFLANMSHELRTPLNSVIGFSEVLIDGFFGELNQEQREYIADIHHSGRHLLVLINDILDISKIEAGRMELQLETFSIAEAIERVVAMVAAQAHKKKILLDVDVPEGLELSADAGRFKQIALNLLSNAIKFTTNGGTVAIRGFREEGTLRLSVRDTGIGIPPQYLPTIFDKFQQVEAGYRRSYGGTGLGLAIVKEFMELHGGRVWAESEVGKGSCFTLVFPSDRIGDDDSLVDVGGDAVPADRGMGGEPAPVSNGASPERATVSFLPIGPESGRPTSPDGDANPSSVSNGEPREDSPDYAEAESTSDATGTDTEPTSDESEDEASVAWTAGSVNETTPPASSGTDEPRVLVVDEDPFALKQFFRYLSGDYCVETATTGEQAIERVLKNPPDLMILKVLLPDMDGWEVLRLLREKPRVKRIPIAIVSSIPEEGRGFIVGASDYFVKPIHRSDLLSRLDAFSLRVPGRDTPPRIVIADDNGKDARLLESYLRPAGFDIVLARGGREAIETIREHKPDLVILDLLMPDCSGFEVVEAIRADGRRMPHLVLTNGFLSVDEKITLMEDLYRVSSRTDFTREALCEEVERLTHAARFADPRRAPIPDEAPEPRRES